MAQSRGRGRLAAASVKSSNMGKLVLSRKEGGMEMGGERVVSTLLRRQLVDYSSGIWDRMQGW